MQVQKSRRFLSIFRIKNGGKGAARDVIEQVMKTQGNGWHILMGNTIRTILNVKL
jgi:3-deoxy-D-manno-octulosonate 8-phosphate phosphatase KdsC-like HAD superfamily phosphatase